MVHDVIGRFDEDLPGERLLQPMMRHGRVTRDVHLEESRRRFQSELTRLPQPLRDLDPSPVPYPVSFSERLRNDLETIRRQLAGT